MRRPTPDSLPGPLWAILVVVVFTSLYAEGIAQEQDHKVDPLGKGESRVTTKNRAISRIDQESFFASAGPLQQATHIALGAHRDTYAWGHPTFLLIGIEYLGKAPRVLDDITMCRSFGRTDQLQFRVVSDAGVEVVVRNAYKDPANLHAHAEIRLNPGERRIDAVDFDELVAGSGALFDLVRKARSVVVVAELRGTRLSSNPVRMDIAHP